MSSNHSDSYQSLNFVTNPLLMLQQFQNSTGPWTDINTDPMQIVLLWTTQQHTMRTAVPSSACWTWWVSFVMPTPILCTYIPKHRTAMVISSHNTHPPILHIQLTASSWYAVHKVHSADGWPQPWSAAQRCALVQSVTACHIEMHPNSENSKSMERH